VSALVFLAMAVVISFLGFGVLYLRSRQPKGLESGIDEFRREMSALSPDDPRAHPRRGPGTRQPPTRPSR
jgi:hypothetical protein